MKQYQYAKQEKENLERMKVPFAVYQFVEKRVVTLILSDGFCELFGYDDRSRAYHDMDHNMYMDAHPDDAARIGNEAVRFATEGGRYEVIYRSRIKGTSDYRVIHAFGKHVFADDGTRLAQVWYADEGIYSEEAHGPSLNRAISNVLHEESILKASRYDYLTGLPSMTWFFELVEEVEKTMEQKGERPVLLYMDLSGMKFFNKKHSFAEGDQLLRSFAKLLSQVFHNENCCRIGADHFAVLSKEDDLEETLYRVFDEWGKANDGKTIPVHVGIYLSQMEGLPVSAACDRAKMACDAIRNSFASCFNFYSQEMKDSVEQRQYILTNLDRAIREKWITAYYQPIVRTVNCQVCDVEALARWNDPEKGFLSPAQFIPFLEESKQIYRLDLHILECVLEKMAIQRDSGVNVVPHSINLSRSDFDTCDIVEEICRRVDAAGIRRDKISIEITESVIGADFDFMKEQVRRFRGLGFPVWMDDFGSGYSSLDVLQSIQFDLLKFDMSFMSKLDAGDNGKIILTELMKMAGALGVDTVCEGVETEEQVRFLREIGCSKLQGYYFSKPVSFESILDRYRTGLVLGSERAEESEYYETISRVNLFDLAAISNGEDNTFQTYFNTLPMGILEIRGEKVRYVRSNRSYRDFMKRFFGIDMGDSSEDFTVMPFGAGAPFMEQVRSCCETGNLTVFDEKMPDGSVVHSLVRKIATNPATGAVAVAVAVVSVTDSEDGTTYADIAQALAADYYNIYVVDLDSDRYIEYSSPVGQEKLAMERHGDDFFASSKRDAHRIFEEDRETFFAAFTKEKIIRELDNQGVFTATYRLVDSGEPIYVNMKITRLHGGNRIIIGISSIDSQMKEREHLEELNRERYTFIKVLALSDGYLNLFTINAETGHYIQYSSSEDYDRLGTPKEGDDFFEQSISDAEKFLFPEDLPAYLARFTKENVMREIRESGSFRARFRLMIDGEPKPVLLKIASFHDGNKEKLVAGVRIWKERT